MAQLSLRVSEAYRLGVRTPDDQMEYKATIDQFKKDVYAEAKKRLTGNREELEAFIETLRSEVKNKNGANLGPVYEYSSLQDEIIDLADDHLQLARK